MKKWMIALLLSSFWLVENIQCDDYLIKINSKLSYVMTKDSGQEVTVNRIQDVKNRLTDDFTKTSRPCPPFCIQPTKIDKNISNIGELEVLNYIAKEIVSHEALLIDTRLASWFELETIPSAINLPFTVIENAEKEKIERVFKIFGMQVKSDGSWDFSKAKQLIVFDNGVWCSQVNHFVPTMLKYHYPISKILYYRAGLQGWKLLGLTTVVHKAIVKE